MRPRSCSRASNGCERAAQAVDRERGGDVGRARQPLGAEQRQRRDRGRRLGAVDSASPSFAASNLRGRQPRALEGGAAAIEQRRAVVRLRVTRAGAARSRRPSRRHLQELERLQTGTVVARSRS